MHILKRSRLLSLQKDLTGLQIQLFSTAGNSFQTQLAVNPHRNAIRFENQNRTWTFQELETHSNAFAYGLVETGFKPDSSLLLWVEKSHTAEVVAAQIGCAKAGVNIVPCQAQSPEELEKAIQTSECSGILFSPNSKAGSSKYIETLNQVIPNLRTFTNGSKFKSDKFSKLNYLIHTGFYTHPGTLKFRQLLVYASKNFNTLSLPKFNAGAQLFNFNGKSYTFNDIVSRTEELRKSKNITEKDSIFVAGDCKNPLAFGLGVLSSVLHGNYTVYTGNQDLKGIGKVIKFYDSAFLVVDSNIANAQSLEWSENSVKSLKSVSVFDRGNASSLNLEGLFKGKSVSVHATI